MASVWEIILIFALKKFLFSIWVLILLLQFLVQMTTWQINYPPTTRILLFEVKRIVLGEFMDDLDLASRIYEAFGVQNTNSKTALD